MLPTWTRWNWKPRLMLSRMRSTSSGPSMRLYVFVKFHRRWVWAYDLSQGKTNYLNHNYSIHFICRNFVSCRARSRTPLLLWRWITAAAWTWTPSWLKFVLSMKKLPTATGPRLSNGTNRRCGRNRPQCQSIHARLQDLAKQIFFFTLVWGDADVRWTVRWWPALNQGWDCWSEPHDCTSSEWDRGCQRTGIFGKQSAVLVT